MSVASSLSLPSVNGRLRTVRKPASKPVRGHRPMAARSPRLALGITVAMGVAIPGLTLALSTVAGRLATHDHYALAIAAVGIGATVLVVSLSHLAWAIRDITHSGPRASWCLAVAVDLSIVLSESVHVFAADSELSTLATGIMVAVTLASMALNCWAFLRAR